MPPLNRLPGKLGKQSETGNWLQITMGLPATGVGKRALQSAAGMTTGLRKHITFVVFLVQGQKFVFAWPAIIN